MLKWKKLEYGKLPVAKLKELCEERSIELSVSSYNKKSYIHLLLKSHFEKGEYTKPGKNVKNLVIGASIFEDLPDTCDENNTHCTGNYKANFNTLDWITFTNSKKRTGSSFSEYKNIYLMDISRIESDENAEHLYSVIINSLDRGGDIFLIQKGNFGTFERVADENGMLKLQSSFVSIDNNLLIIPKFFFSPVKSPPVLRTNTITKVNEIPIDPKKPLLGKDFRSVEFEEPEEKPKKKKKVREYKKYKINVDEKEVKKFCRSVKKYQMNFSEFERIFETESFLVNFRNSLEKLYLYKKKIYIELYQNNERLIQEANKRKAVCTKLGFGKPPSVDKLKDEQVEYYTLIELATEMLEKIPSLEIIKKNFNNILYEDEKGLASLIGHKSIKNELSCIFYSFSKNYKYITNSFINIAFMGAAGTGKTRLAEVIGFALGKSGILMKGHFRGVTRCDMVGEYIGQTAPMTRDVIFNSLEGVLFLDEAYKLGTREIGSRDFGHESITEIVAKTDEYRGLFVMIVGGYKDRMKIDFFGCNEGLDRRFPYKFFLKNYSPAQLSDILLNVIEDKIEEELSAKVCNYIFSLISHYLEKNPKIFDAQAGSMQNLSTDLIRAFYSIDLKDSDPNIFSKENEKLLMKVIRKTFLEVEKKLF